MPIGAAVDELRDYFDKRVARNPQTGCLEWTGALDSQGYGATIVNIYGVRRRAHQIAYFLATGRLPDEDLTLDHLCRVRQCVEFSHLDVVTRGENVRRGGIFRRKEWCKAGLHRLSQTRDDKHGCRECRNAKARDATARFRAEYPVEPFQRILCRAYLHPLEEPNLYIGPNGKRQCLACRKARIARQVIAKRKRRR